ncbi:MAG TPA: hypothetical protein VKT81_20700 [Bryobacteraceae bacterium]|nr:hypothetical protein [Bryobacteraceae bacterium]
MYLFHVLRSFLPLHNPIGFGASDFVEFSIAALLVMLVLARPWVQPAAEALARRTGWCMLFLGVLVIALRLALLGVHPIPTATGTDDFSYLLLADTLAHFRLANATHPMHRFFETVFVLQEPTYSSIYPLGPALFLAIGQLIFGTPWAGVLLSSGLFCALCFWMLRGWLTSGWAFVGGLITVALFGPLNMWMNCYWGGSVSAMAGCLVFGALPRLRDRFNTRDAVLLGLGIGLQTLTRPYESLFLDASVAVFVAVQMRASLKKLAVPVFLTLLPAAILLLAQNKAVTQSWTTLPYELSRYQYGVPNTLTFQANAVPHRALTAAQQLYYDGQSAVHGEPDTVGSYFERLFSRAGFYRFFFLAPLVIAALFFVPALRDFRFAWIAATIVLFALGSNFYPYFFPHYIAAVTCLFVLICMLGLQHLSQRPTGQLAARWILFLCGAHFLFWYGLHAMGDPQILAATDRYETGDSINYGDPQKRIAINQQLAEASGKQLVFVRYFSNHRFDEWIHNAADIDNSRVVYALELAPDENAKLKSYYPDRSVWLLEPDALPPKLVPYPISKSLFLTVQ